MKLYALTTKNLNTGEQVIVRTWKGRFAIFGSMQSARAYRTSSHRPHLNIVEFTPGEIIEKGTSENPDHV